MQYNLSFDIAAILVLSVLAAGTKTVLYTETRGLVLMRRYIHSVLVCAVIDIITAYTISYGRSVPDLLNLILNTFYQYSSLFCVAVGMRTVFNYYPEVSRRSLKTNGFMIHLLFAIITLNMFTGIIFRFENGQYIHGNGYLVPYILSLLIVFHAFFVVLLNRGDRPVVISTITLLFLILPTVFAVIQMIVGDTLLIVFGDAFSALIMLFALETPDYRKLMKTMKELEAAKEEANIANSTKSDFLANMSHEIRTPINGILGMDTMILRDCDDPQITEYAENIRIAGDGLLSIINDILDLSKIESGRMELVTGEYSLFATLNQCYQMNRMRASEKSLKFTFENDPDMPDGYFGDVVRIRQIINNLLSNGIKYTEEGSVMLKVSLEDERTDPGDGKEYGTIVLAVEDTGIGIREEDRSKLFESFTRLEESRNRHIEGTGLGLRITQQLIDLMKGSITIDSEYGKGSVFTVRIPQRITGHGRMGSFADRLKEQVSVVKDKADIFKAPGKKVLVVDDVKMNILVFRGLLRGTELMIDSALSGAESIEMTKYTKYDIIFMDYLMPQMDGIEAFHKIRDDKDNINHDTPVVVLTANAVVGARAFCMKEGFTDYISKPVEQNVLLRITKELLDKEDSNSDPEVENGI